MATTRDENSNQEHNSLPITKNNHHSPSADELLAACYLERSHVLLELQRYFEAAHEAELAASYQNSDAINDLRRAIDAKIAECPKSVKQAQTVEKILAKRKITTFSKQLSNGNEFLQLTLNDKKGRYIIVDRDVAPNEVLLDERPFAAWLKPSHYANYCHHCLTQLSLIVACDKCSRVAFCSSKCKVNSWLQYHAVECEHLDVLRQLSKGHLALRTLIIAGINKAIDFHRNFKDVNYELESHENSYTSVYLLVDHAKDFEFLEIFENSVGASFMALIAKRLTIVSDASLVDVAALTLKHLLQCHVNGIQIVRQDIVDPEEVEPNQFKFRIKQPDESIGFGLYPTLSLLNHACHNVTKSLFNGSQMTFVANNAIPQGHEVSKRLIAAKVVIQRQSTGNVQLRRTLQGCRSRRAASNVDEQLLFPLRMRSLC